MNPGVHLVTIVKVRKNSGWRRLRPLHVINDNSYCKGMMKKDLAERANITSTTMAKMGKDMPVSMEILGRICVTFRCNIGDIVDVVIDDTKEEE